MSRDLKAAAKTTKAKAKAKSATRRGRVVRCRARNAKRARAGKQPLRCTARRHTRRTHHN